MLITGELYTREVAEQVGSVLKYLIEIPNDSRFFEVKLVRYSQGKERDEETVNVRLIDKVDDRLVVLANGREIVRCVTREGKRIDFMFGHETERSLEPAMVFYES